MTDRNTGDMDIGHNGHGGPQEDESSDDEPIDVAVEAARPSFQEMYYMAKHFTLPESVDNSKLSRSDWETLTYIDVLYDMEHSFVRSLLDERSMRYLLDLVKKPATTDDDIHGFQEDACLVVKYVIHKAFMNRITYIKCVWELLKSLEDKVDDGDFFVMKEFVKAEIENVSSCTPCHLEMFDFVKKRLVPVEKWLEAIDKKEAEEDGWTIPSLSSQQAFSLQKQMSGSAASNCCSAFGTTIFGRCAAQT